MTDFEVLGLLDLDVTVVGLYVFIYLSGYVL